MGDDLTILIVEDDPNLGDLWQHAFSRAGYEVTLLDNGGKGIDWLKSNPLPDVLILDYNMPIANGFQVLQVLQSLPDFERVTTVLISANSALAHSPEITSVDMFLQKPMGFKEMKTLVERLVNQHR